MVPEHRSDTIMDSPRYPRALLSFSLLHLPQDRDSTTAWGNRALAVPVSSVSRLTCLGSHRIISSSYLLLIDF